MSLTASAHTVSRRRAVRGDVDRGNDEREREIDRRWSARERDIEHDVEGEATTNEFEFREIRETVAVIATRWRCATGRSDGARWNETRLTS